MLVAREKNMNSRWLRIIFQRIWILQVRNKWLGEKKSILSHILDVFLPPPLMKLWNCDWAQNWVQKKTRGNVSQRSLDRRALSRLKLRPYFKLGYQTLMLGAGRFLYRIGWLGRLWGPYVTPRDLKGWYGDISLKGPWWWLRSGWEDHRGGRRAIVEAAFWRDSQFSPKVHCMHWGN